LTEMTEKDRDDFVILKNDVEHIKKTVETTSQQATILNTSMDRITSKLFNDETTGEKGFLYLAKDNRIRLSKLENIKVAIISVLVFGGGILGWILKTVYESIIKTH